MSEMSDTVPLAGFCYLCNASIDADVQDHFDREHKTSARKPKVPIMSWEHRLQNVLGELQEVAESGDRGRQIDLIDNVLQELYLVRAKVAQLKGTPVMRVKEG
jgi:hypothetical protein